MGQFKAMVKMMTTEPSVELKLKKGGSVSKPKKMMNGGVMGGLSSMPAPGARGGMAPAMAPRRPSMAARRAAMMNRPMMKEGGETKAEHAAEMKKMMGTEAKLKKHASMPASKAHKGLKTGGVVMGQGGFKKGGAVPKSGILPVAESERGAKGYVKTKMDTAHVDKAKGPTGDVKMGKPGGYKTGGVAMGQGGYKKGGEAKKNSDVDLGYFNTVGRDGAPGGGKKGGAIKKHYATGGLVDSGKPVAYPKKPASAAVSNDRQSGTFKKGGKVKFNDGGAAGPMSNYEKGKKTIPPVKDPEAIAAKASRDLEDAFNPIGIFKELGGKLRDKLRGQGAVTETEKSVTVSPPPAKKRAGGAC